MLSSILLASALMAGTPHGLPKPEPRTVTAAAQSNTAEKQKQKQKKLQKADAQTPEAKPVVTRHKIIVGGKEISYTATAGLLPIKNKKGETEAHMFFIAYTVNGRHA
ncbi:MAG: hypothetical protein M0Z75_08080, partial [Nitrospiraceae bacterium]|nr:hypothetical protein [Nitrospiraceae bacterium]